MTFHFSFSCSIKNFLSWILLTVGLLILPFAILTLWLKVTLTDTNQFVKTLSPLSSDPAIVSSVSKNISDNFFQNVNVEEKIREALPENSKFLAPSIALSFESFVEDKGQSLVASKEFNKVWEGVIRVLHPQIINLLEGKNDYLKTQNGYIYLDFQDIISPLIKELSSKGIKVFDNITIDTRINLLRSEKLASIQNVLQIILNLGVILPILSLIFIIGAVLVSENHRKFLVNVGLGISISMVVLLLLVYLGQEQFVASSGEFSFEAISAFYKIITQKLQQTTWLLLILGIMLALGANYLPKKLHIK